MQHRSKSHRQPASSTRQAIGYIRVSTDRQATEGISLEAQQAKINAWCELYGYELIAVYQDAGITGTSIKKREGIQQALATTGPGTALVVYSLSRLSRSVVDTLTITDQLHRTGADLVSVTENIDTTSAAGKMVLNMMAVLAEFERDQTAERTATALQHKKRTGFKYTRHTPYGFIEKDGKLEQVVSEAAIVSEIEKARQQGGTLTSIARDLNRKGIPTKQGKKWQPATIHYLLKRSILVINK